MKEKQTLKSKTFLTTCISLFFIMTNIVSYAQEERLEVSGNLKVDTVKANYFVGDGSQLTDITGLSQWINGSGGIYYNSGNVGIGTTDPGSKFELVCDETITYPSFGILSIKNNHYATFDGYAASNIDYVGSLLHGRRSRGTLTSPENVQAGDRLAGIVSSMYYNNEFHFSSSMECYAGEGLGENSYPSYIVFRTNDTNESERFERMRLTENGYLGIGTTTPGEKLDVNGNIKADTVKADFFVGNFSQMINNVGGPSQWSDGVNGIYYNSGKVGIGTTNPGSYKLSVNGTTHCTSGSWTASDKRYKKGIKTIESALEKVKSMRGANYKFQAEQFKDKNFSEEKQYGFIAQELKEVLPELVKEDEDGFYAVNYDGVIPVLVEALKEQQSVIEELKSKDAEQQRVNEELKAEIAELKELLTTNPTQRGNNTTIAEGEAILYQNNPNPFNQQTEIQYYLSTEISSAAILIFDMNGKQLKSYTLTPRGNNKLVINGGEFIAGMYIYSLIADGKIVDTKKMILNQLH